MKTLDGESSGAFRLTGNGPPSSVVCVIVALLDPVISRGSSEMFTTNSKTGGREYCNSV